MLFNSIIYFLFLAITLIVYYLLPVKYRNYFLIAASAFFYMYVKIEYIFIIIFIIISNVFIGIKIERSQTKNRRNQFLYLSLFINLGILIFFKYWNFLIDNLLGLLRIFHAKNSIPFVEIALPLGLSYYIFQTIGYIYDIYRGSHKSEKIISKITGWTNRACWPSFASIV